MNFDELLLQRQYIILSLSKYEFIGVQLPLKTDKQ